MEFQDAEQLGELYTSANLHYIRTKAGPFHSRMRKAQVGDVTLHSNHHASSMLVEGSNQSKRVAIGFIGPHSRSRRVLGQTFTNQQVFLFGPRIEYMATVLPGQDAFAIFIPHDLLAETIAARLHQDRVAFAHRRYILNIGKSGVSELIRNVEETFAAIKRSGNAPAIEAELAQFRKDVVENVVSVLIDAGDGVFQESHCFLSDASILARSHAFFDENYQSPIGLSDICREVGVGQRKLQLVFADALGVSPMQYLKLRRLSHVREQLLAAEGTGVLIKQVARQAGFVHMGKFGQEYKKLFGETASATLSR